MDLIALTPRISVDPSLRLRSPGQVLLDDYLVPRAETNSQLARRAGIRVPHIRQYLLGSRPMSANPAIRLAAALDTTAIYWLTLQARYELAHEWHKQRATLPLVG